MKQSYCYKIRGKGQKDYILDKRYKRRKHDSFNGLSFLLIQPGFFRKNRLEPYIHRTLASIFFIYKSGKPYLHRHVSPMMNLNLEKYFNCTNNISHY